MILEINHKCRSIDQKIKFFGFDSSVFEKTKTNFMTVPLILCLKKI